MKNVYIDGFQIHSATDDVGYFIKSPIQGLEMPPIRLAEYPRIGEHGAYVSNQLYDGRLVTFEGHVVAQDITTFNQRRRSIAGAIGIVKDANAIPTARLVTFTTDDGLQLQVYGYLNAFTMEMTYLTAAEFKMDIFCPGFTIDSQTLQNISIGTIQGGGIVIPAIIPAVLSPATGGVAPCVNNGNADAFPVITLNGPLTNPIVQNTTTNRFMSLTLTLASGESAVIDMKNKTIVKGTTPIMQDIVLGSQWWWLPAGTSNVQLITGNIGDTGNAQVAFRDAYLGA